MSFPSSFFNANSMQWNKVYFQNQTLAHYYSFAFDALSTAITADAVFSLLVFRRVEMIDSSRDSNPDMGQKVGKLQC